ncbi:MAG: preprotein translocase subunit YajC [Zoogloeaceae bacterium]|jgi:preprotein translocase subunit YajC|nr:preprotein translocase subunit YajC [Zoogloeaceae bacterium]
MISSAFAQGVATTAANPAAPGGLMQFLPFVVIIVAFYFLAIRPQMRRAKEHKALTENLQKGDEVIIQGGLTGRIAKVKAGEDYLALEIASGVEVVVQRSAVQMVLPKGTLKSVS